MKRNPIALVTAKSSRETVARIPFKSAAWRKTMVPTMAPALPAAPDMPWHVERSLAGKISAGTMNVVTFGPKFEKKKVKQ